jgi:HSP20 family protein
MGRIMTKKPKEKAKQSKAIVHPKPAEVVPSHIEADRWFEHVLEDLWRRPFQGLWRPERWLPEPLVAGGMPFADVYEDEDTVVVKAELPGMAREEIEVTLTGETLTIKGEKKRDEAVEERDYHRHERSYGAFVRDMSLPRGVKGEDAKATFKDGVLEVRLPKTEEAKRRFIPVKVA